MRPTGIAKLMQPQVVERMGEAVRAVPERSSSGVSHISDSGCDALSLGDPDEVVGNASRGALAGPPSPCVYASAIDQYLPSPHAGADETVRARLGGTP